VTLALGVGANTAIFSVTNSILLRPHHFRDLERLVVLREDVRGQSVEQRQLTAGDVSDLSRVPGLFDGAAAYDYRQLSLMSQDGASSSANGFRVTSNMFSVLGVAPELGRGFATTNGQPGQDDEILLSHSFWTLRFGADPGVVGSTITVDGHNSTVLGVMPADFNYPPGAEVWKPLALTPQESADRTKESLFVLAHLAPGVSMQNAGTILASAAARMQHDYPLTDVNRSFSLIKLREEQYSQTAPLLLLLQACASFVLLLACANLMVLVLVRLMSRRRELAICTALGASKRRLLQSFMAEAILLSGAATAAAVTASLWAVDLIRSSLSPSYTKWVAGWSNMQVDGNVLVSAILAAVGVALVLGLAGVAHSVKIDPNTALKKGGSGGGGPSERWLRNGLVVAQITLALVLLVGAGLMISSFRRFEAIFDAFDPPHVLRFAVSLPESRYTTAQVADFYRQFEIGLSGMTGVVSTGVITNNPASNVPNTQMPFVIAGRESQRVSETPMTERQTANPALFSVLKTPLVEGRMFAASDGATSSRVAMVSQGFARQFFQGASPIGQRIKLAALDNDAPWITIVGVVGDIQMNWFDPIPGPVVYLPLSQDSPRRAISLVRTAGNPLNVATPIRRALQQLDPMLVSGEMNPYTIEVSESIAPLRLIGLLMLGFGGVAMVLSVIGIYGVVSQTVAQSTREFGIRMALGADRINLLTLVTGRAIHIAGVGVVLGSVLAFALVRIARGLLFGIIAPRVSVFAGFTILLFMASLIAVLVPARRATRINPIETLRSE
jgi:putative ABC transport system permease protein